MASLSFVIFLCGIHQIRHRPCALFNPCFHCRPRFRFGPENSRHSFTALRPKARNPDCPRPMELVCGIACSNGFNDSIWQDFTQPLPQEGTESGLQGYREARSQGCICATARRHSFSPDSDTQPFGNSRRFVTGKSRRLRALRSNPTGDASIRPISLAVWPLLRPSSWGAFLLRRHLCHDRTEDSKINARTR